MTLFELTQWLSNHTSYENGLWIKLRLSCTLTTQLVSTMTTVLCKNSSAVVVSKTVGNITLRSVLCHSCSYQKVRNFRIATYNLDQLWWISYVSGQLSCSIRWWQLSQRGYRCSQCGIMAHGARMHGQRIANAYWHGLQGKRPIGQKANGQKATHHCHSSFPHHCCIFCNRHDFCISYSRYAPRTANPPAQILLANCPETVTLKSAVGSCIICSDDAKRHVIKCENFIFSLFKGLAFCPLAFCPIGLLSGPHRINSRLAAGQLCQFIRAKLKYG